MLMVSRYHFREVAPRKNFKDFGQFWPVHKKKEKKDMCLCWMVSLVWFAAKGVWFVTERQSCLYKAKYIINFSILDRVWE